MDSKACVFLLALLGVALALAGGGMGVGLASKAGPSYAARQLMAQVTTTAAATSMLGLVVHRRVLASISPSTLNPDRPACIGKCPAPGRPYTGRRCQKAYQCAS